MIEFKQLETIAVDFVYRTIYWWAFYRTERNAADLENKHILLPDFA